MEMSCPGSVGKDCFDMLKSIGFGDLVGLFASSRWSDRVYLRWYVWDLVGRLFNPITPGLFGIRILGGGVQSDPPPPPFLLLKNEILWKLNETLQTNSMTLCAHFLKKIYYDHTHYDITLVHFLKALHQILFFEKTGISSFFLKKY